jgi:hypothetical protein
VSDKRGASDRISSKRNEKTERRQETRSGAKEAKKIHSKVKHKLSQS